MDELDYNDIAYVTERYGKPIGGTPCPIQPNGKINPHVTRFAYADGKVVSVFHIKPVYYETLSGHWRPLSEVTTKHGNKQITFTNEGFFKVHPRYIKWLTKRAQLINGNVDVQSFAITPMVAYAHDFLTVPKIGLTTSTFYPDPNTETTTVDGYARRVGVNEAFSTIRSGAGNNSGDSVTEAQCCVTASTTSNQFSNIARTFYLFDTSSIPDSDTIDSGTFSLTYINSTYIVNTYSGGGSVSFNATTPASNTAIANSDYGNVGSTKFATDKTISSLTADNTTYNDWTLNSDGLNAVSKTGVSKFGQRITFDIANTAPTWGSLQNAEADANNADTSGTSKDPKLVIVHSASVTFRPRIIMY